MDLDVLAALAGSTLVTVAVTDTFETVRHKVARLFGHGKPAAAIERRLDETRLRQTPAKRKRSGPAWQVSGTSGSPTCSPITLKWRRS
jgi:hypothetical protein